MSQMEVATQTAVRSSRGWNAVPEVVWSPMVGAILILIPGLLGIALHRLMLFASLGPTAYFMAAQPQQPTARFYNVFVGHLLGFAVGIGAAFLLGAAGEPSVFQAKELSQARLWASVLAVAVTILVSVPLKMGFHPPAASTTLLATLGGFEPTWSEAATVCLSTLLVAGAGELFRWLRLTQPGQK